MIKRFSKTQMIRRFLSSDDQKILKTQMIRRFLKLRWSEDSQKSDDQKILRNSDDKKNLKKFIRSEESHKLRW